MPDFYAALERETGGRFEEMAVGDSRSERRDPWPPAPGLLADEIAELLVRRQTEGRHEGHEVGFREGEQQAQQVAQLRERFQVARALEPVGSELSGPARRLAALSEALEKALEMRANATSVKDRSRVVEALEQVRDALAREAAKSEAIYRAVLQYEEKVRREGLPS